MGSKCRGEKFEPAAFQDRLKRVVGVADEGASRKSNTAYPGSASKRASGHCEMRDVVSKIFSLKVGMEDDLFRSS
jgi:hypothetical protein